MGDGNIFSVLDDAQRDPFDKQLRREALGLDDTDQPRRNLPTFDKFLEFWPVRKFLEFWPAHVLFILGIGFVVVLSIPTCDSEPVGTRGAVAFLGDGEKDKPKDQPKDDAPPDVLQLGRAMYQAGYDTAESKAQIKEFNRQKAETKKEGVGLGRVMLFVGCLERRTGKDIRGDDGTLERYMRGKHGRACKKELSEKTDDEVWDETQKVIEESNAEKDAAG